MFQKHLDAVHRIIIKDVKLYSTILTVLNCDTEQQNINY